MSKPCAIAACDNLVGDNSRTGECAACRQSVRYWMKKRPSEVIARLHAVRKYGERMDSLIDDPRGKKHARALNQGKREIRRWAEG